MTGVALALRSMIEPDDLKARLLSNLEGVVHIELDDLTGTKDHYQAVIVAEGFAGKSRVQQHQLVYKALGELMHGPVHALALTTYTPERWNEKKEN
ncbi:MAG: BolA family transcriptional regulator [Myxococcales bacterium]|nr:BolA family transcriptional regulator [Myxococcales bacterium]